MNDWVNVLHEPWNTSMEQLRQITERENLLHLHVLQVQLDDTSIQNKAYFFRIFEILSLFWSFVPPFHSVITLTKLQHLHIYSDLHQIH